MRFTNLIENERNNLQSINFSDRNNDSQIMSIIVLLNCGLHLVSWKGKSRISEEMTHHNLLCCTGQLSTEREKGLGSNSKPQLFLPLNLLSSKWFHPNISPYLNFSTFSSVKLAVKISFFFWFYRTTGLDIIILHLFLFPISVFINIVSKNSVINRIHNSTIFNFFVFVIHFIAFPPRVFCQKSQ